jgi:hypothetical protein
MILVKDIESLDVLASNTQTLLESTNNEINISLQEVNTKLNEVEQELSISNGMLDVARANEIYKEEVLATKVAEHLYAEGRLASAMASGNPFAVASASSEVARTAHEVMIAEQELEEVRQSRIRMENRVELVTKSHNQVQELLENLQTIFRNNLTQLDSFNQTLAVRLTSAKSSLESYLFQNYNNSNIDIEQNIINERYEYLLLQHKQGNISKKVLNDAYMEKLQSLKENFRSSQYAKEEGVKISKYGLPEFDSKLDVFIKSEDFRKSREKHFRVCNGGLKKKIEEDEEFKSQFSKRELNQIEIGKTPEGYTWHHDGNPPPGRMQLVKTNKHNKVRHDGGYSLWKKRR